MDISKLIYKWNFITNPLYLLLAYLGKAVIVVWLIILGEYSWLMWIIAVTFGGYIARGLLTAGVSIIIAWLADKIHKKIIYLTFIFNFIILAVWLVFVMNYVLEWLNYTQYNIFLIILIGYNMIVSMLAEDRQLVYDEEEQNLFYQLNYLFLEVSYFLIIISWFFYYEILAYVLASILFLICIIYTLKIYGNKNSSLKNYDILQN